MRVTPILTVMAAALAGCGAAGSSAPSSPTATAPPPTSAPRPTTAPQPTTATSAPPPTARPAAPATSVPGGGELSLVVEPDDGIGAIYGFLSGARRTLDVTMYELVDTRAEAVLVADQSRGVRVRVVLDQSRERSANEAAYRYLTSHGVEVAWSPNQFDATHEKAAIADAGSAGGRLLIMTLNLTSRYYSDTRDFAVVDGDPRDVASAEAVFAGDFGGRPTSGPSDGADLVWSPGSEGELVSLITSAHQTAVVENEEMSDAQVVAALAAAARRGVEVRVVMTADTEWAGRFSELSAAGVQVRTYPDSSGDIYIHAKAIVVDSSTAFVGSENFSVASLSYNRELGLVTSDPAVTNRLASVLGADFAGATPWTG